MHVPSRQQQNKPMTLGSNVFSLYTTTYHAANSFWVWLCFNNKKIYSLSQNQSTNLVKPNQMHSVQALISSNTLKGIEKEKKNQSLNQRIKKHWGHKK